MPDHVSCPRCGCACRVQPHDHANCVQCFTSFRPSRVQSRECPHCGEPFVSSLGAGTEAGRFCTACGQYEGFPDANPPLYTCTECRQTTIPPRLVEATDHGGIYTVPARCDACRDLARAPQEAR
jgi:hypothetical protein